METESKSSSAPELTAFDIGCVVVGGIVGVGIFFTPKEVAVAVDGSTQVVAVWAIGGAMAILGALVFAALARRVPGHGGTFVYLHEAFGTAPAFLYGWANWLVIQAGALGTIGLVMAEYLDELVWAGSASSSMDVKVGVAALAILAFTVVNTAGLRVGKRVQNTLTIVKIASVFALVVLALVSTGGGGAVEPETGRVPRGWLIALGGAILPVLFSFGGWQQGAFVAGAARDPERDVPLGIVGGVVVVVLAYITVNLAFLDLLGFEGVRSSETVAEDAARVGLESYGWGDVAGRAISAAVVVSSLGIINTICMAPPFVLHAMAEKGLFFAVVGRLNAATGVPTVGVLVQGSWGIALLVGTYLLTGTPGKTLAFLLAGIVFVDWLFYGACALALLWLLRRERRATAATVVVPLAFAACALAVAIGAIVTNPDSSAWGLGLTALGLPFFALLHRRIT